jgi:hypothetical protein
MLNELNKALLGQIKKIESEKNLDTEVLKSKEICRLSNQVINLHKLNLEGQKLENLGDIKELHEFFRQKK